MKKKVLAISGSTRQNSSNLQLLNAIKEIARDSFDMDIFNELDSLPHFNPDLDQHPVPQPVLAFRNKIQEADGVLFCTPEYVFSLPGALKNAIEWTVSTTLFSEKPVALITASGLGAKAHQALLLIMRTLYARFDASTTLHIPGIRPKVHDAGITDENTLHQVRELVKHFEAALQKQ